MKSTSLASLLTLLTASTVASATHSTSTNSQLVPENERVTYLQYRRDRTAIVRIDRDDRIYQNSMIARVPLGQSRLSETEIAGEVRWGRPRTGWQAQILDKPDGMECVIEHQRTGVVVECWDEEADEEADGQADEQMVEEGRGNLSLH